MEVSTFLLLLELCDGENKPELACWVVKGMCAQLPLLCQPPAESHLADWQGTAGTWVSKETPAGPAEPSPHCRLQNWEQMAVVLSKPLNVGVFCYTEKANLCIFLLPFIFLFLSSYLSSLSLFPPCFLVFSFPSVSTTGTHLRTHKAQKTVAWASSIQSRSHFLLTHPSEACIKQILGISHGLWDELMKW